MVRLILKKVLKKNYNLFCLKYLVPPKIISGMDDDETYESLTKVFNVKARGVPKPKVQW